MDYASWILALLGMATAVVFGVVVVYVVASAIANMMRMRNRRRKLAHHG